MLARRLGRRFGHRRAVDELDSMGKTLLRVFAGLIPPSTGGRPDQVEGGGMRKEGPDVR